VADGYKVLAQSELTASYATVYVVPTSTTSTFATRNLIVSIVSSMTFCNTTGSTVQYYVRIVPSGDTAANKHVIIHNKDIAAKSTDIVSLGVGLQTGDVIDMKADGTTRVSASIFGIEII